MPDPASAHVKFIVTSVLFHPFAFGVWFIVAVMVGGMVSKA
ncbi:MAG: hypothetical protein Q8M71_10210 [Thermodesulfovibrionales bacterium]|nr:hypothetical protein [Thermodesulfovibrionales bacterium]